jgi:hypothetical protein
MKTLKRYSLLFLLAGALLSNSSCIMVKSDNGKHKGWFKNSNNPHHPLTTNPGHTKNKVVKAKSPGNGNNKGKK